MESTDTGLAPTSRDWIRGVYAAVQAAVARAGVAVEAAPAEPGDLREVLDETHAALERHISFECNEMLPRLEPLEHLGPDRVERVRARHERMRSHMQTLQEGRPPAAVAAALMALDAELDGAVQELLIPDVTNDDPIVTDELGS